MSLNNLLSTTQNPDGSWQFKHASPLLLEHGETLAQFELTYETWGQLNQDKSNVVLIHHALSVGAHVAESEQNPNKGWWNDMVGANKPIDTNQYFVICINNLGSCFGSTGPSSINPDTGKAYNADFPHITIADMVTSQQKLIEHLGIKQLFAIIGNSMGAMLSLIWGIENPSSVQRLFLSCSSYKAYPANIANRNIQQSMIRLDPKWNNGNYQSNHELDGFRLARKLGLFTYRNSAEWNRRFNSHFDEETKDNEIVHYMDYNADKFSRIFDANSYLTITTAMDDFDVTQNYSSRKQAFAKISAKVLVVSEDYDILFTPEQQKQLFEALQEAKVKSSFIGHHSQYGHDAFLVETNRFGGYIKALLNDEIEY